MKKIYLDNSATTRISDVALKKYIEISENAFGNPSSLHSLGFEAEREIKKAKDELLSAIGARDGEVIFTASGTEANNLAILGRAYAKERYKRGAKLITTNSEHASVSEPIKKLQAEGYKVAFIPTVGGEVDTEALERELTPDVILVSVMTVNNETGAIYDVKGISARVKAKCPDALVHIDATQGFMKLPMQKRLLGADLITASSHKIHGPKGVGALYIDSAVIKARGISPIIFGGGQALGLRSGTENVPAIAAFGAAIRDGRENLTSRLEKLNALRSYFMEKLTRGDTLSQISPTVAKNPAPHIINITLPSIKSETMLHYLESVGIFVSSGSACSSNAAHKSGTLVAFGRSEREADCSVRISLSHDNEISDIDALCDALEAGLQKLARIR